MGRIYVVCRCVGLMCHDVPNFIKICSIQKFEGGGGVIHRHTENIVIL
jgi:hypothetical protein